MFSFYFKRVCQEFCVNSINLNIAAKNNLKSPEVSVRQVEGTGDHIQLIAELLMIDYDENNRIRKVYAGNLLFTLEKSSFYKWDVINVEEKMKLSL
ncbi:hypothetical protein C7J99_15150 [Brevibacillus brevis]|nr:hypothetical protein C7J99_15150 [Brevibacillus brevis]